MYKWGKDAADNIFDDLILHLSYYWILDGRCRFMHWTGSVYISQEGHDAQVAIRLTTSGDNIAKTKKAILCIGDGSGFALLWYDDRWHIDFEELDKRCEQEMVKAWR